MKERFFFLIEEMQRVKLQEDNHPIVKKNINKQ